MYEWLKKKESARITSSVKNFEVILNQLGDPHLNIPPVIHIAGTNGKGSTAVFLSSCLQALGYSVHVFSSPHLFSINERIQICGHNISDEKLAYYLDTLQSYPVAEEITWFETMTAAAFLAFQEHSADYTILEVGIGGRLDATNVIQNPVATVLTPIAMDHEEVLGESIEQIAQEKIAIMKTGVPMISAAQEETVQSLIHQYAARHQSHLVIQNESWHYKIGSRDWELCAEGLSLTMPCPGLAGYYQIQNAAVALMTLKTIGIDLETDLDDLHQGLLNVRHPGRLEQIDYECPKIKLWFDGAHNSHAARHVAQVFSKMDGKKVLILRLRKEKNINDFFHAFGTIVDHIYYWGESEMPPIQLVEHRFNGDCEVHFSQSLEHILDQIQQVADREPKPLQVLLAGSLYNRTICEDMISKV